MYYIKTVHYLYIQYLFMTYAVVVASCTALQLFSAYFGNSIHIIIIMITLFVSCSQYVVVLKEQAIDTHRYA